MDFYIKDFCFVIKQTHFIQKFSVKCSCNKETVLQYKQNQKREGK